MMRGKTVKKLFAGLFCTFLLAGAVSMNATSASAAAPVTDNVVMTNGGSVRYYDSKDTTDYSGIRFEATINADYMADNPSASYGMLIIPTSLTSGELTKNTQNVLDISIAPNDANRIYGVLYGIPETEYATELSARAYIKNGSDYTYSNLTVNRSIAQVASMALTKNGLNSAQIGELNHYVDGANATIDSADIQMEVGDTLDLTERISNSSLVAKYALQNDEIVRLENGTITALQTGETTVVITLGSQTKKLLVHVGDSMPPVLAQNGETQYRVVIPQEAGDLVSFASEELTNLFYEATGANLQVITDKNLAFNENSKYISIGNTALKQEFNVAADSSALKSSGTRMVTKGNCIILTGAEDYGTLYAVYDFLNYLFDYEYYDVDAYALTAKSFVDLPELDETNVPDFEYRYFGDYQHYGKAGGDDNHGHRLRMRDFEDNSALSGHTVPILIKYEEHPEWYTTTFLKSAEEGYITREGTILCYSNEEMRAEFVKNVKEYLRKKPTATSIGLTQTDYNNWCNCSACAATMQKYKGADGSIYPASTQTLFLNKVVADVNAWLATEYPGRHVWYTAYAYHQTIEPPVNKVGNSYVPVHADMVPHKDIFIEYVDVYAHRGKSFRNNADFAENIKGWTALTKNLAFYEYGQDAKNVCLPYDGMYVHADNIRFAKELGLTTEYKIQGNYFTMSSGFYYLRVYVTSKLMWDTNLDENQLANDYIANVYGEAAPYMQQYYTALRQKLETLRSKNYGYMCLVDGLETRYWDKATLDSFQAYIDQAYAAIEGLKTSDYDRYEVLLRKIKIEEMFIQYATLGLYRDDMKVEAALDYLGAFEADAVKYGFHNWSETKPMAEKLSAWRNAYVDQGKNDIDWVVGR